MMVFGAQASPAMCQSRIETIVALALVAVIVSACELATTERNQSESDRFGTALAEGAQQLRDSSNGKATATFAPRQTRPYRFVLYPPGSDPDKVAELKLAFDAPGLARHGSGMVALIFDDKPAPTRATHWLFTGRATRIFDVSKRAAEPTQLTLEGSRYDYTITDVR